MTTTQVIPGVLTLHAGAFDPSLMGTLSRALAAYRAQSPEKAGRQIVRLGVPYKYMGRPLKHFPIPAVLQPLFAQVSQICGTPFNAAVVNWYANGNVALPPHSDTACIKELGQFPTIAALSFGAPRVIELTPRSAKAGLPTGSITVHPGDLYVMSGTSQQKYYHGMPAAPGVASPRLSVTFRNHAA